MGVSLCSLKATDAPVRIGRHGDAWHAGSSFLLQGWATEDSPTAWSLQPELCQEDNAQLIQPGPAPVPPRDSHGRDLRHSFLWSVWKPGPGRTRGPDFSVQAGLASWLLHLPVWGLGTSDIASPSQCPQKKESVSRSVVSDSLLLHRLLHSPPGSSVHGILQARILEWVAIPFSRGIFPTQGLNPGLLHCRQILYRLSHQESLQCPQGYENSAVVMWELPAKGSTNVSFPSLPHW